MPVDGKWMSDFDRLSIHDRYRLLDALGKAICAVLDTLVPPQQLRLEKVDGKPYVHVDHERVTGCEEIERLLTLMM